ncbi:hypothetical protein ACWCXL_11980 [Streptomyces sp. NPDC001588]
MSQPHSFWPPPAPQIGEAVLYRLTASDVRSIHRQRIAACQRGAAVRAGDVYPAAIVRVAGDGPDAPCNLHVLLDGPDTYWAQQVACGTEPGTWAWPVDERA